ncbi:hypothetical protein [Streptomyces incanus]|uniref:Uncharacterized protein n=1 Tax=Streptomyces incanus TaxID=887453 RepID=A0ABW0XLG9_9ACTN
MPDSTCVAVSSAWRDSTFPLRNPGSITFRSRLNDDLTVEIEHRDGSAAAHYRAEADVPSDQGGSESVEPVLLGWAVGRAGRRARFPWTRWDVTRECPWDENSTIDGE